MKLKFLFLCSLPLFLVGCSTITKKDCHKNMYELGLSHGKDGSAKKYTDDLAKVCLERNPEINLADYEKGFYKGWENFCLPSTAYEMGKNDEIYVSFCPANRETQFRQKYLLGKEYNDIKNAEYEVNDKIKELKGATDKASQDEYFKYLKALDHIKKKLMQLEVESKKDTAIAP